MTYRIVKPFASNLFKLINNYFKKPVGQTPHPIN
jgi:hypothetical protein